MKLLPPIAPDNLGESQAKLWADLAPICSKARAWSPALILALNGYVRELDRLMVAEDWLTKNGSIIYIRDDKGILKSALPAPQLKVARDAAKLVARLGRQLGL